MALDALQDENNCPSNLLGLLAETPVIKDSLKGEKQ